MTEVYERFLGLGIKALSSSNADAICMFWHQYQNNTYKFFYLKHKQTKGELHSNKIYV